jgi:hypothetical protein
MVQNCDNDILDGLAVANLLQTQNPLFLSWRDWRLSLLFPSKPTTEVKCSLIDEYVKKPSAHGTSTFNGSSVLCGSWLKYYKHLIRTFYLFLVKIFMF